MIVCLSLMAYQQCTVSKVKIQLAITLVLAVIRYIPELVKHRVKYPARNKYVVFYR